MFKKNLARNPVFLSTLVAGITLAALLTTYYIWFTQTNLWYLLGPVFATVCLYVAFNVTLWIKKRRSYKAQQLETEEEALAMVIRPLLANAGKKPVYLLLGNKGAGKSQFLQTSNAIKPMDKSRTVKNDFFEWFESESAVYIKPDQRLTFQEVSSADAILWNTLLEEIILNRPRKPLAGCMFFIDFEFLIVHESEQVDYTLTTLLKRLESIGEETASAIPLYLIITKLDKLEGFKEYVQFSPLKSSVEYLTIPLKDAKGTLLEYYRDSYRNLVKVMEANALDSSSHSNDTDEKQAILSFPKQFELCQEEINTVIERLNAMNQGCYHLDIREIFFSSSLQGGRKYNLLAKSCSNYFNLPIIASEHTHLSETPYFTRFLVDSQILPEADFAGENKTYLRRIQRNSQFAITFAVLTLFGGGYFLRQALDSNLRVINQLIEVEDRTKEAKSSRSFDTYLTNASKSVSPAYQAWLSGNQAIDEELVTMKVSRLEATTKIAYKALLHEISTQLMPVIEQGYRIQLTQSQDDVTKALQLLKGYLMLKDPSKRDIRFLRKQTFNVLSQQSKHPETVNKAMEYLDAYLRTPFAPVAINMDLVRATRRSLLAKSNVDLVYAKLLQQASNIDLGTLDIQRAVGFNFNNIFNEQLNNERLTIDKIYTSTGFNTFYRPRVDLMSEYVIADNWVLGLSNHVVPTKEEQEVFKDKVRKKYTDDYISYWRNALSELKVKRYNNIGDLTNAIDLISGPSSPMTTVLKQVYANTQFSPTGDKAALLANNSTKLQAVLETTAELAEEAIKPDYLLMSRVEQAFRLLNRLQISETPNTPTPWEETITALSRVRTYIKDIADSPNAQMAALAATRSRMNSSEADPLIRLKQIAQKSPEPVRSWLLDVVNQAWSVMITEASKGIQTQWYSEVYSKFRQIGLEKYPFNITATEEISLEDFELLFAAGGVLDMFIQKNFSPFYDTNLWTPKRVDGEIMPLSSELLVQMKNYNVIRDTLINKSTNRFFIPFSTKVLDLDSSAIRATVKVADKSINYYHGPSKIQDLQWPPQNGNFNVSITIQDVTDEGKQHVLSKNGQWAIYRLFGDSTLTNAHNGSFVSDIKVSGRELSLRITPLTQSNPFTLPELYNFTLPKNIVL
ncbi:type VI secretion system membrane subunit TssM [uncultured Photobacterium sp.]|uniref:type VI secretion system membrane subunit TssM n=1 Tax=uncultured Photobacterium sp. TaxID=173973 RepID=UPI00261B2C2A|nr:type VI secretion system membrane subunit TssM [uncultured Photobacterium sp.]